MSYKIEQTVGCEVNGNQYPVTVLGTKVTTSEQYPLFLVKFHGCDQIGRATRLPSGGLICNAVVRYGAGEDVRSLEAAVGRFF